MVGGVLAGGAGAIVGAITAKQFVTSFQVIIYKSDIKSPSVVLTLINQKTEMQNNFLYSSAVYFANKINASIKAIIAQKSTNILAVKPLSDKEKLLQNGA